MPVAASDLVAYASANHPEDDTSASGGVIDGDTRVVFTDLATNDDLEVLSSNAGDTTQQATVVARKADGSYVQQTVTLNGTTPVVFNTIGVVERILRFSLNNDATGTVTLRRQGAAGDIASVPPGERGFRRLFIKAFSNPSAAKDYYEKIFFKNNNASLALLDASISESADPTTKITFALATAKNDSGQVANRLTAPGSGITAFGNSTITLLTATGSANLGANETIGVWLKLSLGAGDAPIKSTYTLQIAGQST